ncbi:1-acyl-sn-glycerol-3-phosphate acyltransferase [Rubellimicrobium rubrum]|uniref:1-acyl-sn-glycerol-3-phosphate acyltransferase n=1 Tax=Rubellimicrobium rubrum TaxID=2585369 RepID=A0A5C4N3V8_9RHOB|nr:lysophospholipid acyltransferase family protein [Rubellimicrobium rubrum]TNC51212.1 1-acyl-sn-glycerol-3-phosphate acyltransferase [Rubellimicrobium rubrum]
MPLLIVLSLGLLLSILVRFVELPLCQSRRPVTSFVTVLVCRCSLRFIGLRVRVVGEPIRGPGAILANHSSWLDILVLNSRQRLVFVSKSEVAAWPGIGHLARATGTLFIRREARGEVTAQARALSDRVAAGQTIALFPEGTSTDNRRVLPFKPSLLAGLLSKDLPDDLTLQPVTLWYEAPLGQDPRFYAWYGSMDFGPHALAVLAASHRGVVHVTYHAPIPVAGRERKSLAAEAEASVRGALPGREEQISTDGIVQGPEAGDRIAGVPYLRSEGEEVGHR